MALIATPPSSPMVDMYISTLQFLSNKDKLELVSRLTASMANDSKESQSGPKGLRNAFHGDWGTNSDYADILRREAVAEVRDVNVW